MALYSFLSSLEIDKASTLFHWKLIVLAAIPLTLVFYWRKTQPKPLDIKQYAHFPQPEPADPVRGHWPWIEKAAAEGDPRRAFDEMLYEQAEKLGFPPVLLVDWRPVEKFPILFILDNEVAEQVTKPSKTFRTSMPKHPAIQQLAPLVGARSLVTTDVGPLPLETLTLATEADHHPRATNGTRSTSESDQASNRTTSSPSSTPSSTKQKPSSSS